MRRGYINIIREFEKTATQTYQQSNIYGKRH